MVTVSYFFLHHSIWFLTRSRWDKHLQSELLTTGSHIQRWALGSHILGSDASYSATQRHLHTRNSDKPATARKEVGESGLA